MAVTDQLGDGHLPLVNPLLGGGEPIAANPTYAAFYPGNILFLLELDALKNQASDFWGAEVNDSGYPFFARIYLDLLPLLLLPAALGVAMALVAAVGVAELIRHRRRAPVAAGAVLAFVALGAAYLAAPGTR
jgi:hypothetical protein